MTRRAVYLQRLINRFWNRWSKEYLLELRESHRNAVRDSSTCEIRVGELVMVHNEKQRRGLWKLGKVERLVKGEDDKVRSAIVRVHGDGRKGNTLKRPINKLYPLEVTSAENTTKLGVEDTPRANVAQQSTHKKESTRPKRRTAIKADLQRKQWIANEYI